MVGFCLQTQHLLRRLHRDRFALYAPGLATLAQSLDLLSEFPNLIAKVSTDPSDPSDASPATFHTQDRSDPTFGDNFISGETISLAMCLFLLPSHFLFSFLYQ